MRLESLTLCNTLSFFLIEGSRTLSPSNESSRYSIFKERIELKHSIDWSLKHEEILKIVNLKLSQQIWTNSAQNRLREAAGLG